MGSVIKKRRKRMSKKKHRKLLRKTRHQRRNKKYRAKCKMDPGITWIHFLIFSFPLATF